MPGAVPDAEEQAQLDAERKVRELLRKGELPEAVESLVVQLSHLKLQSVAPLAQCTALRRLDCSRNSIKSLQGAEALTRLEVLNLYSNKLADISELLRLRPLGCLTELDLRLNPVVKQESYRLFAIKYLPRLRRLDGRDITATERTRADCLFANLDCSSSSCGEGSENEHEEIVDIQNVLAEDEGEVQPAVRRLAEEKYASNLQQSSTMRSGDRSDTAGLNFAGDSEVRRAESSVSWKRDVRGQNEHIPIRGSRMLNEEAAIDYADAGSGPERARQLAYGVSGSTKDMGWSQGLETLLQDKDEGDDKIHPRGRAPSLQVAANSGKPSALCHVSVDNRWSGGQSHIAKATVGWSCGSGRAASDVGSEIVDGRIRSSMGEDAVSREIQQLVCVQQLRVRELEARLEEARDEARVFRTRAVDAEARAAAAESKLAAVEGANESRSHVSMPAGGLRRVDNAHGSEDWSSSGHTVSAGRGDSATAYVALPPPALGAAALEKEKMDMAEMVLRQRQLVEMLQESHAILINDSHRLRAELEAERTARRQDALDYQTNWAEFETLRQLVQSSPAFEGQTSHGSYDGGAAARETCADGVDEDVQGGAGSGARAEIGRMSDAMTEVSLTHATTMRGRAPPTSFLAPAQDSERCTKSIGLEKGNQRDKSGGSESAGEGGGGGGCGGGGAGPGSGLSHGTASYTMGRSMPTRLEEQQRHMLMMRALEMAEDDAL